MSIKAAGGVFGRNPTFNDVTVEGDLSVDGTLSVGGNVLSGLDFEGAWDATSGAPSATPSTGQFWIVSVAGTTNLSGITNWGIGDWALYDGSAWQRIEGGADGNFNQLTSSSTTILNGTTIPASKTLVVTTDIGSTVEAYDATILKSADIGSTVQGYDADTAKYDDTTANFTGTLQNGGSNVVVDSDIGSTVEAYDATILKSADIGSTVQGYDADTAKLDVAQTWTALQSFDSGIEAEKSSGTVSTLNRTTDDGYIQEYKKDGTTVGVIGTRLSHLFIGKDDTGVVFQGNDVIIPIDPSTQANRDAAISIGSASARFKDLHLSGNVIVASGSGIDFSATSGTGTSELLDDYEEGSVTLTLKGSTTDPTTPATTTGSYTKIGNLVHVSARWQGVNVTGAAGNITIDGLPFSSAVYSAGSLYGSRSSSSDIVIGTAPSSSSLTVFDAAGNAVTWATTGNVYWLIGISYKV